MEHLLIDVASHTHKPFTEGQEKLFSEGKTSEKK